MQAIEHELEVTVRVHEVRSQYERQMEEWVSLFLTFLLQEMNFQQIFELLNI